MTRESNGIETSVLTSWKEIANYMGKGVRTVQRWERQLGLPVRRPVNCAQKRIVLARRADLDAWIAQHWSEAARAVQSATPAGDGDSRDSLHRKLMLYRELHTANQVLYEQFREAFQRFRVELTQSAELTQLGIAHSQNIPGKLVRAS